MDKVELAKKGDAAAFTELIEENKIKMYKTAKAILKNEDDVCDAIQEALMSAYKNISKLNNNAFFSTWLIRILINKCYDICNKNKNRAVVDIDETNDEELRVYDTVMYYYDDLSVKEISQIMNIPEGTVKSRLSRARAKLYDIISKEGEYDVR